MLDGLIFDIDGTLWDATDVIAIGYNRALEKEPDVDVRVTGDDLKKLFGLPVEEIGRGVLPQLSDARREEVFAKCIANDNGMLREMRAPLYEGVKETLRALSEKLPLFIVSNCHAGYAEACIEVNGIDAYIKEHLCPDDNGKTKAENIALICEKYGLKHAFYVGDTARDESSAREAGTGFVHATYGYGTAEAPDATIAHFAELLEFVEAQTTGE